jgi:hypothetical protein
MSIAEINQIESAKMDNNQLETTLSETLESKDDALKTGKGSIFFCPLCPLSIFNLPCLCIPCCVSFVFI